MAIHHKPDLIKTNHLYFQIQLIKIVLKQLKFVDFFWLLSSVIYDDRIA